MSNDKDVALLVSLEVEQACKKQGLPFVLIIGLPETESGAVRSSFGLIHEERNRDFMTNRCGAQFFTIQKCVQNQLLIQLSDSACQCGKFF